jgi:CBS-domain-containing membrane protein
LKRRRIVEKPLKALVAADLMSGHGVEAIPREMSLQGAAHLLSQAHISGAPVVDEEGRCVGVLSSTDFLRWAEKGGHADHARDTSGACVCSDWQMVDERSLPEEKVCRCMTADPVTVNAHARITDLARMMVDAHIHRVIVVDGARRPIGIVTSTDILAAVARAGEVNNPKALSAAAPPEER